MNPSWTTVRTLLKFARKRSRARGRRQQELLNRRRGGKPATDWGFMGVVLGFLLGCMLHGAFAWLTTRANTAALEVAARKQGRVLVRSYSLDSMVKHERAIAKGRTDLERLESKLNAAQKPAAGTEPPTPGDRHSLTSRLQRQFESQKVNIESQERSLDDTFRYAGDISLRNGEDKKQQTEMREHFRQHGSAGFTTVDRLEQEWNASRVSPPLVPAMTTLFVAGWFIMLAFQGEGLELDFQRRRHPMWEWVLSHPVKPGAMFAAEMLSPLAANPFFLSGPVFWIARYVMAYDGPPALFAGLVAGVAMSLAACCTSKALEIAALVRLSPRSRGAVLGIMSWIGYASMFAAFMLLNAPTLMHMLAVGMDRIVTWLPVPCIGDWTLGLGLGSPAAWKGVAVCLTGSALVIASSVGFSAWATNRGLVADSGGIPSAPAMLSATRSRRWLRDPLYRKELLWFWRDRGAVVQVILIPLTMAAFQVFNFRGLIQLAGRSWHLLGGLAVLMGTYFLFILGPRSLLSEGSALWLPLTWPRGLESLLKAKARLWWGISTVLVTVILIVSAVLYPKDAWRIALIGLGWFLFSGSLAEKTVTLVSVASTSGEPEPVPRGRRWAASLGTFTFAVGVLSQQWSLAFAGVVYSWITSAAMWQNFRARLPFLFDPWSEKLPPAPTLMHAMIAISAMVEVMSVFVGIVVAFAGAEHVMFARAMAYGVLASITWIIMDRWLANRSVLARLIWRWSDPSEELLMPRTHAAAWALGGGLLLGILGWAYQTLMPQLPGVGEQFVKTVEFFRAHPAERWWLLGMAVFIAPLAEEYLFRGLLYRALDREWGGWRAMAASALFFAIYHPPMAWLPVGALGLFNAFLFKRTGRLLPCVLVHGIYNAIVVLAL